MPCSDSPTHESMIADYKNRERLYKEELSRVDLYRSLYESTLKELEDLPLSKKHKEEIEYFFQENKKILHRNDVLARISCKALTELEKLSPENEVFNDVEVLNWWLNHKAFDENRKYIEEAYKIYEQYK